MLRITSGSLKGRMIEAPTGSRTRPTQARLRQALFNSIQVQIPESIVLDLFAGSGALGFESLSRGAQSVTFVDSSRSAVGVIAANAKGLRVESQIAIHPWSVEVFLKKIPSLECRFDLVLADPPYEDGWELRLLNEVPWLSLLRPEGLFCLEWGVQKSSVQDLPERVSGLLKVREKRYGDSVLTTYMRESADESSSEKSDLSGLV